MSELIEEEFLVLANFPISYHVVSFEMVFPPPSMT